MNPLLYTLNKNNPEPDYSFDDVRQAFFVTNLSARDKGIIYNCFRRLDKNDILFLSKEFSIPLNIIQKKYYFSSARLYQNLQKKWDLFFNEL